MRFLIFLVLLIVGPWRLPTCQANSEARTMVAQTCKVTAGASAKKRLLLLLADMIFGSQHEPANSWGSLVHNSDTNVVSRSDSGNLGNTHLKPISLFPSVEQLKWNVRFCVCSFPQCFRSHTISVRLQPSIIERPVVAINM